MAAITSALGWAQLAVMGDAATMSSARGDEALVLAQHGPFRCSQAVIDQRASQSCGRITYISSVGGMTTATGGLAPYAIGKSALNMLTKRLAFELGVKGISCGLICLAVSWNALKFWQ